MTGYGYAKASDLSRQITVEIRSVNHRFFDASIRCQRSLMFLEDTIRQTARSALERGHIDVFVDYKNSAGSIVNVNDSLAGMYQDALSRLADRLQMKNEELPLSFYAALPEILTVEQAEDDKEQIGVLLMDALSQAICQVEQMRLTEGENLKNDLLVKLSEIENGLQRIEQLAPQVPIRYAERLERRIAELIGDKADPQRIAQEVGIMADRCAVDEEITRFKSHIAQFRETIHLESACGKKLDFLIQEMNREMNTIGSKASDESITRLVVQCKTLIEKLREQIQNVI